jgi:hypothetical protein
MHTPETMTLLMSKTKISNKIKRPVDFLHLADQLQVA